MLRKACFIFIVLVMGGATMLEKFWIVVWHNLPRSIWLDFSFCIVIFFKCKFDATLVFFPFLSLHVFPSCLFYFQVTK